MAAKIETTRKPTEKTKQINELIARYAQKKGLKTHIAILNYFHDIFSSPENSAQFKMTFSEFKGFLHHLRWHAPKNIFFMGKGKYRPLEKLRFLCKHLNIPIYEFLVIFNFYSCPDLNLQKNSRNDTNLRQFLADRVHVPRVVSNKICDAAYFNEKWAVDALEKDFFSSVTFTRMKRKDCGILGPDVAKGVAALWAICIVYDIPFYQMLEHIGIYDEK